jgi:hypothetical protein
VERIGVRPRRRCGGGGDRRAVEAEGAAAASAATHGGRSRGGKEISSDYSSDSNPAPGYYSYSSYKFDFGSDPTESESDNNTIEEPLSRPATGLVITSTPAGRFVY